MACEKHRGALGKRSRLLEVVDVDGAVGSGVNFDNLVVGESDVSVLSVVAEQKLERSAFVGYDKQTPDCHHRHGSVKDVYNLDWALEHNPLWHIYHHTVLSEQGVESHSRVVGVGNGVIVLLHELRVVDGGIGKRIDDNTIGKMYSRRLSGAERVVDEEIQPG